jgi:hypothetical protein
VANVASAVQSARGILAEFAGSLMDQSIYGFGATADPEPSPGQYNLASLTARINVITSAGGIPVITLVGAPPWMYSKSCEPDNPDGAYTPPCPEHYGDFAALSAHIAQSFPQVKYFVVWNEFKGFYKHNQLDYTNYTQMYNDVYTAIKQVRPDALVGGPYAPFSAYSCRKSSKSGTYSLSGTWGCIEQSVTTAFSYWVSHNVGADFIAVDGSTEVAKSNNPSLADPVIASEKFVAVDRWIESQSKLPIWWMESHIAPLKGWSIEEGAAARIATLVLMNTSGASVGMQWQPQEQTENLAGAAVVWPDEGLWTTPQIAGGGQPTPLATELRADLPTIQKRLTRVSGEPQGVVVAKDASSAILVNTNSVSVVAHLDGSGVDLGPDQVMVKANA